MVFQIFVVLLLSLICNQIRERERERYIYEYIQISRAHNWFDQSRHFSHKEYKSIILFSHVLLFY